MLIQPAPSADPGAATLPGSATFPAPPLTSVSPIPSLSATAAASFAPEAADQTLAKYLANLKVGISRVTAEREALAVRVEQLAALNLETAAELTRAREEQAREAARAAARADSSATGLKQLQERMARLSGQFQEVQSAMQQGAARNVTLAELARRAQDELTQLARERNAALARTEEATARAEEATARLAQMHEEREALRGELAALTAENKELSAKVYKWEARNGKEASGPAGGREEIVGSTSGGAAPEKEEAAVAFADIFPDDSPLFPDESPLFPDEAPLLEEAQPPFVPQREEMGQQAVVETAAELGMLCHFPPISEPLPEPPTPDAGALPFSSFPSFPSFTGFGDDALCFGSADLDELPSFVLQTGLQAIECRETRDVVSLYHPVNVANLSLDGKGQEICQGYICCIRRGSGTEVFAAIVGVKSGRIRIYAPEYQPRDDDAAARAVRGAVAFGEQVGLVMEEKTSEPAGQQMESVLRCPVLKFSAER